jgi:penicillin-binding protein 2
VGIFKNHFFIHWTRRNFNNPLQMANVISAIANRGYYYTPHAIRAIDDKAAIPQKFKEKHKIKIDAANFEAVVEGMAGTMINGTAARTGIEGIEICGKTGTVQNPHGKNHAVFMCFAPKDNPKDCYCVYCRKCRIWSNMGGSGCHFNDRKVH